MERIGFTHALDTLRLQVEEAVQNEHVQIHGSHRMFWLWALPHLTEVECVIFCFRYSLYYSPKYGHLWLTGHGLANLKRLTEIMGRVEKFQDQQINISQVYRSALKKLSVLWGSSDWIPAPPQTFIQS